MKIKICQERTQDLPGFRGFCCFFFLEGADAIHVSASASVELEDLSLDNSLCALSFLAFLAGFEHVELEVEAGDDPVVENFKSQEVQA